jgi:hypothetical protein
MYRAATSFFLPKERKKEKERQRERERERERERREGKGKLGSRSAKRELNVRRIATKRFRTSVRNIATSIIALVSREAP